MKYIYDILLNFNEELYYFFEWKESDFVEHVKRIPLIKVSQKDFMNIKKYKTVIQKELLDKLYNSTEVYQNKSIKLIEYSCLFTDGEDVIAAEFNYRGFSIMKSDLMIDEGNEIIEISNKIKCSDIKYEIISKEEDNKKLTRLETEKVVFLNREIKMLYKNKNFDKLKYLFYECFNILENDVEKLYNNFILFINNEWSDKHNILYDLLKLTYSKNK